MREYVVGFMFRDSREQVLMIEKNRPVHLAGLFNGLGGKVEPGEVPVHAMVREFHEECGVETGYHDWVKASTFNGEGWRIHVYASEMEDIQPETMEDEEISWQYVENVMRRDGLPTPDNLPYMLMWAMLAIRENQPFFSPTIKDDARWETK